VAYVLFVDESGHDRREAPYAVLAGVAVRDQDLWNLVQAISETERRCFDGPYSSDRREIKGRSFLKKKVFQHLRLNAEYDPSEQARLARVALDHGSRAGVRELKALAQAKVDFVKDVLVLCLRYRCAAFASIVDVDAPSTQTSGLRKDYAYLFQGFYHFLESSQHSNFNQNEMGIIVFDELEKSQSHILLGQCSAYFRDFAVGRARARYIVPEPFFVHSDLTTGVQLADLVVYLVSWNTRWAQLTRERRPELDELGHLVMQMRQQAQVTVPGSSVPLARWSFTYIRDLRTQSERELE